MPLLSDADRQSVMTRLASLEHSVTMLFFSQTIGEPASALTARQILAEISSLNDRVVLEDVNFILDKDRAAQFGIDRIPAIVLLRDGEDTRIRFLGAPSGYEFASLVDAVVLAGTGESGLTPQSRATIAAHGGAVDIKVFVTPSCPHCPRVVTLAHRMAVESPSVVATCIEATEFLDLAQRYRVTGVPKTIVEGTGVELLGAVSEATFVETVLSDAKLDDADAGI